MKKTFLTLAVVAFSLTALEAFAQDKAAATQQAKTERSAENIQKEADALKNRIAVYTEKVEANKENPKVDYEAEKARIEELKVKWETLTNKKWKDEK